MPPLREAAGARDAFAAIVAAIANGELTPGEAATLCHDTGLWNLGGT